jgi:hypothetical protein
MKICRNLYRDSETQVGGHSTSYLSNKIICELKFHLTALAVENGEPLLHIG